MSRRVRYSRVTERGVSLPVSLLGADGEGKEEQRGVERTTRVGRRR